MPQLSEFTGAHYGEAMVVCGLGRSIRSFRNPERFRTIGVNDIGRAFTPTYLFVMDTPKSFGPERFQFIRESHASYIFTDQDLGLDKPNIVKLSIRQSLTARFDDPETLYMIGRPPTSPFLAICLAAQMGAKAIGLIGVDFVDGHFFSADGEHKLSKGLAGINARFYRLGSTLLERGVKVFNLSAESRLNAFPRLSPDAFFALQQSAISRSWSRPAKRVCLFSNSRPTKNLRTIARLINSKTTVSCRLIAPESPDIQPASSPEIEEDVLSSATVKLECDKVRFPDLTSVNGSFPQVWDRELRPLLFKQTKRAPKLFRSRALSVCVIVSQGEATGDEAAETVRNLSAGILAGDELVVLSSGAGSNGSPSCQREFKRIKYAEPRSGESCIAARDRIARNSSQDILIFTDSNIQAPQRWLELLLPSFDDPEVAAAGPAIVDLYDREFKGYGIKWADAGLSTDWLPRRGDMPYPVPFLPRVFLAVRRTAFECVGGLDAGMQGVMGDDLELCFRFWTHGFQCVVVPEFEVLWMNAFAAGAIRASDYWCDQLYNMLRLASVHFGVKRRDDFARELASDPLFPSASARVAMSDAIARRRALWAMRKYSDEWFFAHFRNLT
ncbi:MAG: glycosyltransferase [Terracidiphilus sp.]